MAKPEPKSIDPGELWQLALKIVETPRCFPMLATMDGDQPRLRPVSPVRNDDFVIYIANLRQYHKTKEIDANAKVELCYMDSEHNQVRITGVSEHLQDETVFNEIWESNKLLRDFMRSPDNPALIIYKVVPNRVRYMQEWALEYYEVPL